MRIAVPRETAPGERRVALVPESAKKLIQAGYDVAVESGAGDAAGYPDAGYRDAGATIEADAATLLSSADLMLKVGPPALGDGAGGRDESGWMRSGAIYLGSLMPLRNPDAVRALASHRVTAFSTDAIPRTTRAQSMDTLSSMANIAGYKGVLLAATELNKYFPMLMTAAGMVPPAKVFVIGAAVAGLQAIATAKRLGANVVATDVRPEVKEQIESVGGKYVGIELGEEASAGGGYAKELSEADKVRQRELLAAQVAQSDVVITTALIGGVFAPRLITADMVRSMKPGAVIVDLAADGGGNCELSRPGETARVGGVTILAPLNLPASMPLHASLLFSRNLTAFVQAFTKDKHFQLDFADDIQQGALITHDGEVKHARTRDALQKGAA
jgi:H+-translocating NAD(P) transhydrogenase subunit alpha